MAQLDLTSFEPALKTLYANGGVKNLCYKRNPFFALLNKFESFTGDSIKEPIQFGTPQNRGAAFTAANTINTTSRLNAFLLTRVQNYSMAAISNEVMLASEGDEGAFLRAAKLEIDGALMALTRSICTQLFRNGTGTVARLSATATLGSTSVYVTLATPSDICNLEVGMSIAFSATDGGAVRIGTAFIISINRQEGSFLCSGTPTGLVAPLNSLISGVAVGDYIYANASDRNAVISGLGAWLPGGAVTNTLFFGVDRTADKTRLAGVDYDGSTFSIEEAIIDGTGLIAREGGNPDHAFVSYVDFQNLVKAMGSKQQFIQYTDVKVSEPGVSIGFSSLMISGPNGPIKVIPDQNCPAGFAFLLQMDTWTLRSLGEAVRLFDGDGRVMIRDSNADNLLIRCFSYAQLSCRAPGWNGVIKLPSA